MPKTISVGDILALFGVATNAGTFGLSGVHDLGSGKATLTWTWPDNMEAALIGGGLNFHHLTLQRSTTSSASPTSDVAYIVIGIVPVPDANWADVKQWGPTDWNLEGNPTTYQDTWTSRNPVAYRLILNCSNAGTKIEMDWTPFLIVPSQELTIHPTDQNDPVQPRLTWSAPSTDWWP